MGGWWGVKDLIERAVQGSNSLVGQYIWNFGFCTHCSRKQENKMNVFGTVLPVVSE